MSVIRFVERNYGFAHEIAQRRMHVAEILLERVVVFHLVVRYHATVHLQRCVADLGEFSVDWRRK